MVDRSCQVPAPGPPAWAIDLTPAKGRLFVIVQTSADAAQLALINHLVESGDAPTVLDAQMQVAEATCEYIGPAR